MSRPGVTKLSREEIEQSLASLEHWSLVGDKLHRELEFESFIEAFAFMTKVAMAAERMDHHPEWWNVYNRVTIELMTHDERGITNLDVELARTAEHYFSRTR